MANAIINVAKFSNTPIRYTVEPLSQRTLQIMDTVHLTSLYNDKFRGPYRIMTIQFTSERGQPLYRSKVTPKLTGPKVLLYS